MNNDTLNVFRVSGAQKSHFSVSYDASPAQDAFPGHEHPYYEFFLLLSGDVEMNIAGTIYPLAPNDLIVIPQGVPHRIMFKSQAPYRRSVMYVSDARLRSKGFSHFADLLEKSDVILENISGTPFLQTLPHCAKLSKLAVTDAAQNIIFNERLLSYYYILQMRAEQKLQSGADQLIERAVEYINANLSEKLTIESIAEQLYTSGSYLCRIFRQKMGIPLMHYVNRQRIHLARELIQEGVPLKEVYLRCGYENYVTFFRVFRAETGASPSEFAKPR
jgi:AraC-like DNA-binding protein